MMEQTGSKNAHEGYNRFVEAVQHNRILPGSNLTQAELCEILGMSLTPLRDALVLLEEYGLIKTKRRAGISVLYPDIEFYRQNFQTRMMIETFCLRTGIFNLSPAWVTEQRAKHLECLEDLKDESRFDSVKEKVRRVDQNFHLDLVRSIDNETIVRLHDHAYISLRICIEVHRKPHFRQKLIDTIHEHLALIDAIEARDADAAVRALDRHLQASTSRTYS